VGGWRWLVKDPRSAAWKARACYGGDAGRLLDLCRARLVFPDADGAAACLRAVAADPGARALRVRNGMRDGEGGGSGFRVRNPAIPPPPPPLRAASLVRVLWRLLALARHGCMFPAVILLDGSVHKIYTSQPPYLSLITSRPEGTGRGGSWQWCEPAL
jgi:hypothetical protein